MKPGNDIQLALSCGDIVEKDLAYFAGLFDGEGSVEIRVAKGKEGKYRLSLGIILVNTYEPILNWIANTLGGKVYPAGYSSKGSRLWRWQFWGKQIRWLLNAILPYLKIKKDEVELLLYAITLVRPRPGTLKAIGRPPAFHPDTYWQKFRDLEIQLKQLRVNKKILEND